MIRERIIERLNRYRDRDPHTIYIHMLDVNIYDAVKRQDNPPDTDNGFFVVGELIHAGIESILEPAPTRCVEVDVWLDEPILDVATRFVKRGKAKVCGTADGMINGYPVEVKTTARKNPPINVWKRRARHYAVLYDHPVILFIVDRIRGETTEIVIDKPRDSTSYMRWIINEWLRNRYPYKALDSNGWEP